MDFSKIKAALNAAGLGPLSTSGPEAQVVGPKTIAAIKEFQKRERLAVDGIVGPATLAKMFNIPVPLSTLPAKFAALYQEPGPRVWLECLKNYGVMERPGKGSNETISGWAKELGVSGWYTDDDTPWCGLFAGAMLKHAGYQPPRDFLAAKNFLNVGRPIPIHEASFMDLGIYARPGGNHVNFIIGQNTRALLGYGGNQSNAVGFTGIEFGRCIGIRRLDWINENPQNIRQIILADNFAVSQNEA